MSECTHLLERCEEFVRRKASAFIDSAAHLAMIITEITQRKDPEG